MSNLQRLIDDKQKYENMFWKKYHECEQLKQLLIDNNIRFDSIINHSSVKDKGIIIKLSRNLDYGFINTLNQSGIFFHITDCENFILSENMLNKEIPKGYEVSKYSDSFEKFLGSKLYEYLHEDELIYGFSTTESRHQNQGGSIHGGILMTAMDHILAMHILRQKNPPLRIATIQLNSYFIARGIPGYFVIAKPKIVKKTR